MNKDIDDEGFTFDNIAISTYGKTNLGTIAPSGNLIIGNYASYPIQGEMVVSSLTFSELEMLELSKDEIRRRIVENLAHEISDKVEFTRQNDVTGTVIVRGRVFLVPSADVQLLRKMEK